MRTSEKVMFISVLKVGICCEMLDGSAARSVMLVRGGCLLKQDSLGHEQRVVIHVG